MWLPRSAQCGHVWLTVGCILILDHHHHHIDDSFMVIITWLIVGCMVGCL
eukprot:NODE_10234_length_313_cov_1.600775.p2 GENE.NODE_10234_length_313_cov_1.600775~~NODE_10234_length_313_cov_1.600775.p2  ORF type:complete len:50 (+),score=6.55 NODE_10234_length_313_cov_1.600775:44-193(+)